MSAVAVFPDAAAAALDVLHTAFTHLGTAAGVGLNLPAGWKPTSTPFVRCQIDAAFDDYVIVTERQTVRGVVYHHDGSEAFELAQLARGILVAHSGDVLRRVRPLTGPFPAIDDVTTAPIASFTVEALVRSTPV